MKFSPIFKTPIWGGERIKKLFNISCGEMDKCGEMWLLSSVKDNESILENGHFKGNTLAELSEAFMDDFFGENIYNKYSNEFPLLIKIIDANDNLSVQVHPDDKIAKQKHNLSFGKSEMWYVIDAEKDSSIVAGFNQEMDKQKLSEIIENGNITDVLNFVKVKKGDIIYLPAGTIHALGSGIVVAEIQQSSDITYRLFDWNRVDDNGNGRELHVEQALSAINYEFNPKLITDFNPTPNATTEMIKTPYFSTSFVYLNSMVEKNLELFDSVVIYMSIEGGFDLEYDEGIITIEAGQCVAVPAIIDNIKLTPKISSKIIEIIPH